MGNETLSRLPRRRAEERERDATLRAMGGRRGGLWKPRSKKKGKDNVKEKVVEEGRMREGESHEMTEKSRPGAAKGINATGTSQSNPEEGGSSSASSNPRIFTSEEIHTLRQTAVGRRTLVHHILGSRESHEMAYMYQNRCWNAISPSEPLPKWPLGWVPLVWRLTELDLLKRCIGLDGVTQMRFLRGVVWFMILQLCTTMVILLPLHYIYSNPQTSSFSMLKGGLSLTGDEQARKWLWVHVVLVSRARHRAAVRRKAYTTPMLE